MSKQVDDGFGVIYGNAIKKAMAGLEAATDCLATASRMFPLITFDDYLKYRVAAMIDEAVPKEAIDIARHAGLVIAVGNEVTSVNFYGAVVDLCVTEQQVFHFTSFGYLPPPPAGPCAPDGPAMETAIVTSIFDDYTSSLRLHLCTDRRFERFRVKRPFGFSYGLIFELPQRNRADK